MASRLAAAENGNLCRHTHQVYISSITFLAAWYVYVNLSDHSVFDTTHRKDWQALGQIIPKGAKVAAPWDATELYVYAAPQARYLNLLDPVFMAVPYPSAYLIQKNIWNGYEPDVPSTVKTHFDCDYIVFPYRRHIQLYGRLSQDPRAKLLYRGHNALFRLMPDMDKKFMVNWKIIPDNGKWPPEEGDINEKEIYYPSRWIQSDRPTKGISTVPAAIPTQDV